MVIYYSRNKCQIITVGKTPKGSAFFKAIYKTNNQTRFSELFLKKANGEERVLTIRSIGSGFNHKRIDIEDSKDNKIVRDSIRDWLFENGKSKTESISNINIGKNVSLKRIVYKAHKAFIDNFVGGVELPPEEKPSLKSVFKRIFSFILQ
jgi:hypothetical protein